MKKKNLYWLVESAVMLALAIVLEMVSKSIVPKMAFGGQITIVSMLPIVLVGWKYGIGKGLITGFVYSLVEMVIGVADGTITAYEEGTATITAKTPNGVKASLVVTVVDEESSEEEK